MPYQGVPLADLLVVREELHRVVVADELLNVDLALRGGGRHGALLVVLHGVRLLLCVGRLLGHLRVAGVGGHSGLGVCLHGADLGRQLLRRFGVQHLQTTPKLLGVLGKVLRLETAALE